MAALLQLNPPLFCVTPKGDGIARLVIDYGPDLNPVFVVELDETREWLCFDLKDMRGSGNPMWNLTHSEPPASRA
jgi:hypothetical protein